MVTAVVLAYNRCSEVLITIGKLKVFASALPFKLDIIVIDNASTDGTSEEIKTLHPDIELIRIKVNKGIAGWNDGFSAARNKYILVLDDDSHIESGLIEAIAYLEKNDTVGILALNITTGPYLTDSWIWQNGKPWQHEENILGFFGCGAIIRKDVYDRIGGFAEWLGVYAHEWEYGLRCMEAGYEIKYFKHSSIVHRASPINRSPKRLQVFGSRNEMGIIYKYFDKRWQYIARMWLNNLKRVKTEGLLSGYYYTVGALEFLKMRGLLSHTPVDKKIQQFFIKNYRNTFPVLNFLKLKKDEPLTRI